jgi:hypothetical protein
LAENESVIYCTYTSPYRAPSYFHPFGALKDVIRGEGFVTDNELKDEEVA